MMGNEYLHVMLNLLVVVMLIIGFAYIVKRLKLSKFAANKYVKIINIVPIGTKEKIILLEVNNVKLLLGATPAHIETLYVFNDAEQDVLQSGQQESEREKFSDKMASLTS